MHWYFALSETSIDRQHHDWRNLIRVAVQSARVNTNLKPHMLYDGAENEFIQEMRECGVVIITHRSTLYNAFKAHRPDDDNYLRIASGAFLRFDIPIVEQEQEFVLYTDCDVIFRCHPKFFGAEQPEFFAATSQTEKTPSQDMNSGVMLINVNGMRNVYSELIEFTQKNLHVGLDQEILRVFFESRYTAMDMSLNWKPYWGVNLAAQIVHFHGPKPSKVEILNAEGGSDWVPAWKELYSRNLEGYTEYNGLWASMLSSYVREDVGLKSRLKISQLTEYLGEVTLERNKWKEIANEALRDTRTLQPASKFMSLFRR